MAHVIAASPDFLGLDVALLASDKPKTEGQVRQAMMPPQAPVTQNLPVSLAPGAALGGQAAYATIDDYYETIHVRPARIDVGRITSPVRRQVEVWNAYRAASRTLSSLDATGNEGITLTGAVLPVTLGLLASTVYTLEVTPDGPARVDARYDLAFTTPERDPHFRVLGTRIIEWSIPPDWAEPFEETWAFKTEVITAFDGSEQRLAVRHRPRRTFRFAPTEAGARDRDMRRLLATWQNRTYAMADWPRGVTSSGVAPGGNTVFLGSPLEGLAAGGLLVLRHGDESLIGEVQAVDGLQVTLNAPVVQGLPEGTRAFRGLTVHADASLSGRRLTSHVGRLAAQFREMPVAETLEAPAAAATTWRGLEVFLTRPNWRGEVSLEHEWPVEWLDSGRGAFGFRVTRLAPQDTRRVTFTLRGREEVAALRDFVFRCKGRRGEVYVPTWDEDLVYPLAAPLGAGNAQLAVSDKGDVERMAAEQVYRNICVRLTDGTTLFRHVIDAGEGAQGPILVLDTGWPRNIEPGEIVAIHWMPKSRLATDDLTLRWLTDGVAEATLAFATLPDLGEDIG